MGSVPRRPIRWQHQRHQQWDLSERAKALDSHELQVPRLSCIRRGFQAWDTFQDNTDNSSIDKVQTSFERQEHFSQFQDTTDALPCHIHLPVCLWIMDPHSRAPKKNASQGNEVLLQDTTHLHYILHYNITKTMLPTRKSVTRSNRQLDHMKTYWPL